MTQAMDLPRTPAMRRRPGGARVRAAVADAGLGLLVLVSLATLFARAAWLADMLSFFRPYLLAASLLVLLATLVARSPARVLLALALVVFNAWPLLVRATPLPQVPAASAKTIRVMSINLLFENRRTDLVRRAVEEIAPDILVVQEADFHWPVFLATLTQFPYRSFEQGRLTRDVEILSRFPFTVTHWGGAGVPPRYGDVGDRPALRAVVEPGPAGRSFVLYGIHPQSPHTPAQWHERGRYLDVVADLARAEPQGTPVMVAGDWNMPPWSPFLPRFLARTRLAPVEPMPWPKATRIFDLLGLARPSWLGSPVDRIAVSGAISVADFHVGPFAGSDHLPIYADVAIP